MKGVVMNVMRLSEMKEKPKKAGLAKLQFGYKGEKYSLPCRVGKRIILPDNPDAMFLFLKEGNNFLYEVCSEVWFGGTDESVFLVRLNALEIYLDTNGILIDECLETEEDVFYEALKPDIIKTIEKRLKCVSKRQGDIWAVPLGFFSMEVLCSLKYLFWAKEAYVKTAKRNRLFGTRHRLTGKYIIDTGIVNDDGDEFASSEFMIAQGVVEAPNHSPMKLDCPHGLAQTAHLFDSKNAD